ncbi:MAG TPA: hypothetical protein VH880_12690 [Anaeromyxobacteraceae bacterium]|jgi:hypothetical protein
MRKLALGVAAAALAAAPAAARGDFFVEGSAGVGWEIQPDRARQPTNLMVAPGYQLAGILSLELGVVGALGDVQASKFDLQLRPMAELTIPLFPLYLKGILAVNGLVDSPVQYKYGAALGTRFGLFGVAVFLEAGILPGKVERTSATGGTTNELIYVAEGRVGVRLG